MKFDRTKIVATIGPASCSREVLEKMFAAGLDVCRINGSHGNHEWQQQVIDTVRDINQKTNSQVALLYDLQGPKIRIGDLLNSEVELKSDAEFILSTIECVGDSNRAYIKYKSFAKDVKIGETILVDDGKIELRVVKINNQNEVVTKVICGGILSSRKGVNLPNTKVSIPSLTPKDKEDLEFVLKNNVEWIGLSFVRSAADIEELKSIIRYKNKSSLIIAKIEKPEAVKAIDAIIKVADGVMVARGDLGVEMPMEEVPLIQKMIVKKCIEAGKPVIIATQMMESMISAPRPTRAEVNDVGNSVIDGADAVMLSAETSVGSNPVNVIEHMARIINTVQQNEITYWRDMPPQKDSSTFISDSILYNAVNMAKQSGAKAIVTMTHSGSSALKIASMRPQADIFLFTDNKSLLTTLSLVWGVRCFYYDSFETTDVTIKDVKEFIKNEKLVEIGDRVIHVFSTPLHARGRANTIKLNVID